MVNLSSTHGFSSVQEECRSLHDANFCSARAESCSFVSSGFALVASIKSLPVKIRVIERQL